jgi:hypothetical protein
MIFLYDQPPPDPCDSISSIASLIGAILVELWGVEDEDRISRIGEG